MLVGRLMKITLSLGLSVANGMCSRWGHRIHCTCARSWRQQCVGFTQSTSLMKCQHALQTKFFQHQCAAVSVDISTQRIPSVLRNLPIYSHRLHFSQPRLSLMFLNPFIRKETDSDSWWLATGSSFNWMSSNHCKTENWISSWTFPRQDWLPVSQKKAGAHRHSFTPLLKICCDPPLRCVTSCLLPA